MHDAVVTGEILEGDMADVFFQFMICRNELFPGTVIEQSEIASSDSVTGLPELVNEMYADVASMAGDKNLHGRTMIQVMRAAGPAVKQKASSII